jgi:hypothetical protein
VLGVALKSTCCLLLFGNPRVFVTIATKIALASMATPIKTADHSQRGLMAAYQNGEIVCEPKNLDGTLLGSRPKDSRGKAFRISLSR